MIGTSFGSGARRSPKYIGRNDCGTKNVEMESNFDGHEYAIGACNGPGQGNAESYRIAWKQTGELSGQTRRSGGRAALSQLFSIFPQGRDCLTIKRAVSPLMCRPLIRCDVRPKTRKNESKYEAIGALNQILQTRSCWSMSRANYAAIQFHRNAIRSSSPAFANATLINRLPATASCVHLGFSLIPIVHTEPQPAAS